MSFFFFKHKTAYEMRISDWSSDVCSSDLLVDEGDIAKDFRLGKDVSSRHRLIFRGKREGRSACANDQVIEARGVAFAHRPLDLTAATQVTNRDRKSTRLNSSH